MNAFVPRRLRIAGVIFLAIVAIASALGGGSVSAAHADAFSAPWCVLHPQLCTEANNTWTWNNYTYNSGHDEPSLLFYSDANGSGNSSKYNLTLPTDPHFQPNQAEASGCTCSS